MKKINLLNPYVKSAIILSVPIIANLILITTLAILFPPSLIVLGINFLVISSCLISLNYFLSSKKILMFIKYKLFDEDHKISKMVQEIIKDSPNQNLKKLKDVKVFFRVGKENYGAYAGTIKDFFNGNIILVNSKFTNSINDKHIKSVLTHELGHLNENHRYFKILNFLLYNTFIIALVLLPLVILPISLAIPLSITIFISSATLYLGIIKSSFSRQCEYIADSYTVENQVSKDLIKFLDDGNRNYNFKENVKSYFKETFSTHPNYKNRNYAMRQDEIYNSNEFGLLEAVTGSIKRTWVETIYEHTSHFSNDIII